MKSVLCERFKKEASSKKFNKLDNYVNVKYEQVEVVIGENAQKNFP
jgi:hypothetical protein